MTSMRDVEGEIRDRQRALARDGVTGRHDALWIAIASVGIATIASAIETMGIRGGTGPR